MTFCKCPWRHLVLLYLTSPSDIKKQQHVIYFLQPFSFPIASENLYLNLTSLCFCKKEWFFFGTVTSECILHCFELKWNYKYKICHPLSFHGDMKSETQVFWYYQTLGLFKVSMVLSLIHSSIIQFNSIQFNFISTSTEHTHKNILQLSVQNTKNLR